VDEVFITLPLKRFYTETEKIVELCEKVGVEVEIPLDFFPHRIAHETVTRFGDIQLLDFYTSPKMNWQLLVKRWTDILTSAILLTALFPIFVLVSILIKTTSRGPIHFKQQRIGYNGRLFTVLKFRTMVEDAQSYKKDLRNLNEMDGPVFKIKNDPRITKMGRILRKASIDELPQLINVLRGEMSLVGPRPPTPDEVIQYELTDRRRLSMKPGMTCIWQVSGRNNIPFKRWMDLDRQYIDNWSLRLDLRILVKTIPAVLKGSGT
jgi:exopolysaccharide biosynthesis polyprenyl glycosylphosphotransferase